MFRPVSHLYQFYMSLKLFWSASNEITILASTLSSFSWQASTDLLMAVSQRCDYSHRVFHLSIVGQTHVLNQFYINQQKLIVLSASKVLRQGESSKKLVRLSYFWQDEKIFTLFYVMSDNNKEWDATELKYIDIICNDKKCHSFHSQKSFTEVLDIAHIWTEDQLFSHSLSSFFFLLSISPHFNHPCFESSELRIDRQKNEI